MAVKVTGIRSTLGAVLAEKGHHLCPALAHGLKLQFLPDSRYSPNNVALEKLWHLKSSFLRSSLLGINCPEVPGFLISTTENNFYEQDQQFRIKPLKVGVLFSGGPAPGGHNVLAGIFDYIKSLSVDSKLIGFQMGPEGLTDTQKNPPLEITSDIIDKFRNSGGFHLLGTSRKKLETPSDFAMSSLTLSNLGLNGLVIIGGDDSNTNAAFLADYLVKEKKQISVIGVPKTIDGDLRFPPFLPFPFGFHTATRVYANLVGNVTADALSAQKLYHVIKLMGRSASWVTLEVALLTGANLAFIGEEIKSEEKSLDDVVNQIVSLVEKRLKLKKRYGVILVPEGIVEFIPEIKKLIKQINQFALIDANNFKKMSVEERASWVIEKLPDEQRRLFENFPNEFQKGLLSDLDAHGNVQVSKIPSERLLIELARRKLSAKGIKISFQEHFFGYEGRCAFPTPFDADYCYNLGFLAGGLIKNGYTGVMAAISNLHRPFKEWQPCLIPLTSMLTLEERKGEKQLVIAKRLIHPEEDNSFTHYKRIRESLALDDLYRSPGPIQFDLADDSRNEIIINTRPKTLELQGNS